MLPPTPWLWLYRPQAPTARAQAIQVVHMAHAMAGRGHPVTLAVEPSGPGIGPAEVLDAYGLGAVEGLRIHVLPRSRTAAGIAFRGIVAAWLLQHRRRGIVFARSKRYAWEVLRARTGVRLIVEAHEVDSAQAAERGEDPTALRALEDRVFRGAAGVVANAAGTLDLLREAHPVLPPAVAIPNGTAVGQAARTGRGVGYVGSVRDWKDLDTLARAAAIARLSVTIVGATGPDAERLEALGQGFVAARPPVPYRDVAATLGGFRVLVVPLGKGLLPERLTSPLKLADCLATGLPVVAAEVPSIRAIAGEGFVPYRSGDPEDLARALRLAHDDEAVRARLSVPRVRSWADRAAEVEAFVASLGAA